MNSAREGVAEVWNRDEGFKVVSLRASVWGDGNRRRAMNAEKRDLSWNDSEDTPKETKNRLAWDEESA